MGILLRELGYRPAMTKPPAFGKDSRVLVRYDRGGRRLPEDAEELMWLDFGELQKVRICPGHNIQGAMQPHLLHIDASKVTKYKGLEREPTAPVGVVITRDESTSAFQLQ